MTSYDCVKDTVLTGDGSRSKQDLHDSKSSLTTDSHQVGQRIPGSTRARRSEGRPAGDSHYRQVGLLALQNILIFVFRENSFLKSQKEKLEKSCTTLRQHLVGRREDQETSERGTLYSDVKHDDSGEDIDDTDNDSLLSMILRNLPVSQLKVMLPGKERTNERDLDLVKENHDLREALQHTQSIIEGYEREIGIYHQLQSSHGGIQDDAAVDRSVVTKLSQYDQMLSVEKTMVRELGIQLQQRQDEVQHLQHQLDLERYGRRKTANLINDVFNSFVLCCIQMPYVAMETELKSAFADLMKMSEQLVADVYQDVAVAVAVASDDRSRDDILREQLKDFKLNDIDEMTSSQLRAKIIDLHDELKALHKTAKRKIVDQMRKQKQATLNVKDLEEKLKKADADRRLIEEQLGDELRKTRLQLNEFIDTLGHRSSYAEKAARSVRSLVELMEEQKQDLLAQRDQLGNEVSRLQTKLHEKEEDNDRLQNEVSHIKTNALHEATKTVQNDMERLSANCKKLGDDNKTLSNRVELLEKENRQEREKVQLFEERNEQQQRKVQLYESEISDLQARNRTLEDTNKLLESKVKNLEQRYDKLSIPSQQLATRQPFDPTRSELQGNLDVSWSSRELPYPALLSRSSPSPRPQTGATEQEKSHDNSTSVSTGYTSLTADMTSSYSQSSRLGLSSMSTAEKSRSVIRPGSAMPFTSLQGVGGNRSGLVDSGLPFSFREGDGSLLHRRSFAARSPLDSVSRNVMKCLRCGTRFSVNNLDEYEKHIRQCYSDVS